LGVPRLRTALNLRSARPSYKTYPSSSLRRTFDSLTMPTFRHPSSPLCRSTNHYVSLPIMCLLLHRISHIQHLSSGQSPKVRESPQTKSSSSPTSKELHVTNFPSTAKPGPSGRACPGMAPMGKPGGCQHE
jgi:hypothetical protein